MSDAVYKQIQKAMSQKNTALTGVYGRNRQRLFLLKAAGNTKKLINVFEVTKGFLVIYDKYREQMFFNVAIADESGFMNFLAQTSYLGFGVPDTDNNIEVYAISFDARDRVAPNAKDVFWSLFATRKPEIRYKIV